MGSLQTWKFCILLVPERVSPCFLFSFGSLNHLLYSWSYFTKLAELEVILFGTKDLLQTDTYQGLFLQGEECSAADGQSGQDLLASQAGDRPGQSESHHPHALLWQEARGLEGWLPERWDRCQGSVVTNNPIQLNLFFFWKPIEKSKWLWMFTFGCYYSNRFDNIQKLNIQIPLYSPYYLREAFKKKRQKKLTFVIFEMSTF